MRLKSGCMHFASAPQVDCKNLLHPRAMGCWLFTVNKDYKGLKRLRVANRHQYLFRHRPQINCAWLPLPAPHLSKYYYSQANTHNSMFAAIESTRFDKQVAAIARIPVNNRCHRILVTAAVNSNLCRWIDRHCSLQGCSRGRPPLVRHRRACENSLT